MAIVTDPSLLADGSEVTIDTAGKTITVNETGDVSSDGVTLKALYSFLKEQWKNDPNTKNLAAFPFPMTPITDESFEFIDGWDFANDSSRYLIRTAGWTVRNLSGAATQIWSGIIGLGNVEADDQPYFYQGVGNTITDFQLPGQVNQAVQVYEDLNGDGTPDYDYRADFTMYVREQGQVFGQSSIADIGVSEMANIAYRFPLSTANDLKINTIDTDIDSSGSGFPADTAPYSGMTITYYATPQTISGLAGGDKQFGVIIDANGRPLQEVYNWMQYALRQIDDINDTTPPNVYGKIADAPLYYVGDTLYTEQVTNPAGGGSGVFISNFAAADQNSVIFPDNSGNNTSYPYVASLTINFNPNLVNDGAAEYWVYYTNPPSGDDWGTSTAVIVQDASSIDMQALITGDSASRTYDWDANSQAGRTAGPESPPFSITAVAIGLATGQYVRATTTMTRSKTNAVSLVAPLERNYSA